jgi:hypothetical protein
VNLASTEVILKDAFKDCIGLKQIIAPKLRKCDKKAFDLK